MKTGITLLILALFISGCQLPGKNKSADDKRPGQTIEEKTIITARNACILSEISYCSNPENKLEEYLPGWKIVWKPVAVGGNFAFVASNGSIYAISIRGSLLEFSEAALSNWIYNDLNVAKQIDWNYADSGSNARIAAGAYAGWENMNKLTDSSLGKNLWDFLKTIPRDAPVVITGHSLGGNLASVYASYLSWQWKQEGHPRTKMNVITFAAPAAGNDAFVKNFDNAFPNSLRIENSNDIVPKFPVTERIKGLGNLFSPVPAASSIPVGYKNLTVDLSNIFSIMSTAMNLLRITNGISPYVQTNGEGMIITIPLSGKNNSNSATGWFAEAGYQHGMAQYAKAFDAPVIECDSK
ncbi:MAG: lipase family protein [Chitinophagaceae bacterium]|nr:lipase family protein [Chitinophagaceae bacterium]